MLHPNIKSASGTSSGKRTIKKGGERERETETETETEIRLD